MSKKKFHCMDPWLGICASFDGNISIDCCHFQFSGIPWDMENEPLRLAERFNDPFFQRVRAWQSRSTLQGTGCNACEKNPMVLSPGQPEVPPWCNSTQKANYLKAISAWENRDISVDYLPTKYVFDFGRACNLNCIMCTQADVRRSSKGKSMNINRLLDERKTIALASHVLLFGGEPLFIDSSRRFLDALLTEPALTDVGVEVVTNAYYLKDFLDKFSNKKRVSVIASLDATGKIYESVRKGSNWNQVSSAIRQFSRLKAYPEHQHWDLLISSVIMKSTLPDLPNLIRFALDNGASTIFYPCYRTRHNAQEDIFGNPELLKDIPNWHNILDESSRLLKEAGHADKAQNINDFANHLNTLSSIPPSTKISNNFPCDFREIDLKEKRVAIWGTGSYYRLTFREWLNNNHKNFNYIGFADNNEMLWGTTCDGFPILSPEQLAKKNPEVILVATIYKTKIAAQIMELGLNKTMVA